MAGRLVRDIQEDYLTCRICLQKYRQPKQLPCEHVFCRECLKHHVEQDGIGLVTNERVTCPLCRTELLVSEQINVSDWIDDLPDNMVIVSLLLALETHKEVKESVGIEPRVDVCTLHKNKQKDAYCETDCKLMCWECAARDHKSCEVTSAEDALRKREPEFNQLKELLKTELTKVNELSENDRHFENSRIVALREIESLKQRLVENFQRSLRQIDILQQDVRKHYEHHLRDRAEFYSLVTTLLDMENKMNTVLLSRNAPNIIHSLSQMTGDVLKVKEKVSHLSADILPTEIRFSKDSTVANFLLDFNTLGFIDVLPSSSGKDPQNVDVERTGRSTGSDVSNVAPPSIAHILRRHNKQSDQ